MTEDTKRHGLNQVIKFIQIQVNIKEYMVNEKISRGRMSFYSPKVSYLKTDSINFKQTETVATEHNF